ncbi:MAG: hypothetical protein KGL35_20325 [Bradyrhizobium sp.]|nr:hypothetical protein [Bradyrhizobium sp.]
MSLPEPDENPREFLTLLVAAGIFIFNPNTYIAVEAFRAAESFVAEAEKRIGSVG